MLPQLPTNGAHADIGFEKDLWEAAVQLRGNIAPADYKHFVLPLLFLRYLSLKYERRDEQLELALKRERESNTHSHTRLFAPQVVVG